MKALALIVSLFAATAVSARSLFKTDQNALVDDPKFPVPGKNPLNVRQILRSIYTYIRNTYSIAVLCGPRRLYPRH